MKSVGEAMSIGRTFKEALQKGIRSMEVKRFGLGLDKIDKWWQNETRNSLLETRNSKSLGDRGSDMTRVKASEEAAQSWPIPEEELNRKLSIPSQGRLYYIRYAFKMGRTVDDVFRLTNIDPWFLTQMKQLVDFEDELVTGKPDPAMLVELFGGAMKKLRPKLYDLLTHAKQLGYSDVQIATAWGSSANPAQIRRLRISNGIQPVYKLVDTCAAEFEAATPYYYSTYESPVQQLINGKLEAVPADEIRVSDKKKIIILGGGPNRIGQGIEFDYCCVQAAFAAKELGFESVMVNSNPETVSTDYDTSDLLFFEPLTQEDVLNIVERLNGQPLTGNSKPETGNSGLVAGVIVQFGGQTPLNLARGLKDYGVPIIGTAVESIEAAEDREKFNALIKKLHLKQPEGGIARSAEEARAVAKRIGYPVLVRPSFVLGGRAMEIVSDEDQLNYYIQNAVEVADEHPVLIDRFLGDATEMDVDCIGDGTDFIVCGLMEHIEEAGIHSGDSACSLPPFSLPENILAEVRRNTLLLAKELNVKGLMNIQFAIKDNNVYILEVNPRASRTVPFVSKATGVSWARIAAKVMMGKTLKELGITGEVIPTDRVAVKESVFPFNKFPGVDVILGPEMRSTGEVMGLDTTFPLAFAKSQMAAGGALPLEGTIYLSVRNADKEAIIPIARKLADLGFPLLATGGTHAALTAANIPSTRVNKIKEGRPNIIDTIKNKGVALLINTPTTKGPKTDEGQIRAAAVMHKIPIITTLTAAHAAAAALAALKGTPGSTGTDTWSVKPLQDYYNANTPAH
jgi:carbamoyl-phosphate synthase large subunit